MKTLIDLYPALTEHKLSAGDPRRALINAPALFTGGRPVRHPAFSEVCSQLISSVKANPLTQLIGVSGVGKTRVAHFLAERLNGRFAAPGWVPVVVLVAPTAQRQTFSWKAFWERLLCALYDPLPGDKIHPRVRAEALRARSHARMRNTSESQYFEMVCSAASERGLLLLVIDEATALARSERGTTLLDQLAVLRELADLDVFRILLVSTFDILPHFRRAGVLDRRLSMVVFSRYAEVLSSVSGPESSSSRSIDPTDPVTSPLPALRTPSCSVCPSLRVSLSAMSISSSSTAVRSGASAFSVIGIYAPLPSRLIRVITVSTGSTLSVGPCPSIAGPTSSARPDRRRSNLHCCAICAST